jgi:hypothetical protein
MSPPYINGIAVYIILWNQVWFFSVDNYKYSAVHSISCTGAVAGEPRKRWSKVYTLAGHSLDNTL